jgi:hypothetical protein
MKEVIAFKLLEETLGLPIEIISNEYQETPSFGQTISHHKVVFQIRETDPDIYAIGILFVLSLMSFTFAGPRGYSDSYFIPDEEWNLGYFVDGLLYEYGNIQFTADYISDRLVKTDIVYRRGGRVTIKTTNRGKGADRWLSHLQGEQHIQDVVKKYRL